MSEDIYAQFKRDDDVIVENVLIQIDKISSSEAASYQGSDPHFTYNAYTVMLPTNDSQLIQYRDYIIDQFITDALTGQPRRYLIVNDPEMHIMDGHWQFVCTRIRGT
ncbi:MAG TPA: hypothetical protein VL443_08335 [Cyclobacteriaceae bacterium]|jgi:hypothetical protein|nr:hypothetical protein [Cyclobacteriaceae bacterium]